MLSEDLLNAFLETALREDLGDGDHSSLACIPEESNGAARLLVKDDGILAGMELARMIFSRIDPELKFDALLLDGDQITHGDIAFTVDGRVHSILKSERLVLNVMQRMSGIASRTYEYVQEIKGLHTRILDTRKTAPGIRILDKEAVRIGGGMNHRMGLYDMILLKDNHIDYAGGIEQAIANTHQYLARTGRELGIEVEARSLRDVREILRVGKIDRIMLDNFSIPDTRQAVEMIQGRYEIESSGRITLNNIREYAKCGIDFISIGALTHQVRSLDLSLKAIQ